MILKKNTLASKYARPLMLKYFKIVIFCYKSVIAEIITDNIFYFWSKGMSLNILNLDNNCVRVWLAPTFCALQAACFLIWFLSCLVLLIWSHNRLFPWDCSGLLLPRHYSCKVSSQSHTMLSVLTVTRLCYWGNL